MVFEATRRGLGLAFSHKKLAAVLWLCGLAIAAAAGVPAWLALASLLGPLPHADALAEGFRFGILADVSEMRPGLLQGLLLAALGATALGVLAGALATGGVLEVLSTPDESRSLAHRFGRGAFRFFGRFLRAGIAALVAAALLGGLLAAPFAALSKRAAESAWEPARLANGGAGAALAFLGVLVALLALDAARVIVVREDARGAARAYLRGLRIVLRHPVQWLGTWAVNALLVAAALAAYLALRGRLPSAAPLAAVVALQQAFAYSRCLFRTALLGSAMALVDRHAPRPVPVEEPASGPAGEPQPREVLPVPVPADGAAAPVASDPAEGGAASPADGAAGSSDAEPSEGGENRPR
jgi:hypothetical protein